MKTLRERFFAKVRREGECVVWTGSMMPKKGYGQMRVEGKTRLAHHVSWFIKHGRWPRYLMHSCDNPACVLPAHLTEGDAIRNSADMVRKGRSLKGERSPTAKLTEADVLEIRSRYMTETVANLSKEFGVSEGQVCMAARGVTWAHLSGAVKDTKVAKFAVHGEMLTMMEIAEKYKIPFNTVKSRVRRGSTGGELVRSKHQRR